MQITAKVNMTLRVSEDDSIGFTAVEPSIIVSLDPEDRFIACTAWQDRRFQPSAITWKGGTHATGSGVTVLSNDQPIATRVSSELFPVTDIPEPLMARMRALFDRAVAAREAMRP